MSWRSVTAHCGKRNYNKMKTNNAIQVRRRRTLKDIEYMLTYSSSMAKSVCGVTNNYAILVMLDAHDRIKKTDIYRHQVKLAFKQAISEMQAYRRMLKMGNPRGLRFFNLNDMTPETRNKYGDITNEEYYDYWESIGSLAYTKTKDLMNSLAYKYEKVLIEKGCKYHKELAWVMVASVALSVAVGQYEGVIQQCSDELSITAAELNEMLSPFNMNNINMRWKRAWELADPECSVKMDKDQFRNIELGIEQLSAALRDPLLVYDSVIDSTSSYDEIFASKKKQKEIIKEMKSCKSEFNKSLRA